MSAAEDITKVTDVTAPPKVNAAECLVVIHRRHGESGKCIKLAKTPVFIGRGAESEIEVDEEGVSRRHARLDRSSGELVLTDLSSTNGTLLNNVELKGSAPLKNGDQIKIGSTIFKYLSASDLEAAHHEEIYQTAITDYLTQLKNKRYFEEVLAGEFSRSTRHSRALSLLLIDIDHFKRVNDERGHNVGDFALQATARAIQQCLRIEDTLARFGGEEIVALLPETNLDRAVLVAEKIRASVEGNLIVFREDQFSVTVSIGCAEFEHRDAQASGFVERCDAKLYEAKHAGRNRVRR